MPLKVLYTYIDDLLPHQLFHPSIYTTFKSHMRNMKRLKDCAVHAQSQDKRHYLASLK